MEKQDTRRSDYLSLFMKHRRSIHAYILAMVCDVHLADDLMQETALFAWDHFDDFEMGTNFLAWVRAVSRNKILEHCKRVRKKSLLLPDELLEKIEVDAFERLAHLDRRLDALQQCVKKLHPDQLELMRNRYENELSIHQIAESLGKTTNAIYKTLSRIHCALKNCVQSTLKAWEFNV
ncbi:MAG: sigma-70 family RNA polymerase sigma factor [Planctomycetota bacterium]|jgi:RNA polymerase sigma-70 factor (ECF subfamily)